MSAQHLFACANSSVIGGSFPSRPSLLQHGEGLTCGRHKCQTAVARPHYYTLAPGTGTHRSSFRRATLLDLIVGNVAIVFLKSRPGPGVLKIFENLRSFRTVGRSWCGCSGQRTDGERQGFAPLSVSLFLCFQPSCRPAARAVSRRNGKPTSMTSRGSSATGRQIASPPAMSRSTWFMLSSVIGPS